MFLTAVLQAHTDSASKNQPAPASRTGASPADKSATVALPEQLEKALSLPASERLQPLPAAHRSRWI